MNRTRVVDRSSSDLMRTQFSNANDPIGIDTATFIWNHARNELIIMVEANQVKVVLGFRPTGAIGNN